VIKPTIIKRCIGMALNAALCTSAAALVGCNQQPASSAAPSAAAASSSSAPAPASSSAQAPPYTPPSADQLYQLVAPIALFPDKLVAQVLAGSTYPDQVTAADGFLAQNQNLQGTALQDAVVPQSWDPSIKGLTVFPKVLDQMAQNIPWTTALGDAYVNDPTDVLNAVQVMRQRASKHGTLRNSPQLQVVDQPVSATASYDQPPYDSGYPPVYSGPGMIPAPQQTIEILPAQSDTVYVPDYDPQTVYGEEVPVYPSYRYEQPGYSRGNLVETGAISFGVGILVGALLEHSSYDERPNYGWNSWDMRWGGGDRARRDDGGWQQPAVVHNNSTYVSNSTTVVNRYTTNNVRNTTINNSVNHSNNRINNGNTPRPLGNERNPAVENRNVGPINQPVGVGSRAPARVNPGANLGVNPAVNQARVLAAPRTAAAAQPHAPNFNGALSKGPPARFAHPVEGPAAPARTAEARPPLRANPATGPAPHIASNNTAPHVAPNQRAPYTTPGVAARGAPSTDLQHRTASVNAHARPAQLPAERASTPSTGAMQRTPQHAPVVKPTRPPQHPAPSVQPTPTHEQAAPRIGQQRPPSRPAPVMEHHQPTLQQAPPPRPQAAPAGAVAPQPRAAVHPAAAPRKDDKHPLKKDDQGP
jgi:hypothetical protein